MEHVSRAQTPYQKKLTKGRNTDILIQKWMGQNVQMKLHIIWTIFMSNTLSPYI